MLSQDMCSFWSATARDMEDYVRILQSMRPQGDYHDGLQTTIGRHAWASGNRVHTGTHALLCMVKPRAAQSRLKPTGCCLLKAFRPVHGTAGQRPRTHESGCVIQTYGARAVDARIGPTHVVLWTCDWSCPV